jgi:ketosteroid isomerase-like protein
MMPPTEQDLADLIRRSTEANVALVRGDASGYFTLITHADDFTLMNPFGGGPTLGVDTSSEYRAAVGRFFKSGTFDQEVVATYAGDLVVLVTIERVCGEIGGLPEQEWSLRVTQVYRRDGSEWRLVHRHADPLVHGVGVEQAAALARPVTAEQRRESASSAAKARWAKTKRKKRLT